MTDTALGRALRTLSHVLQAALVVLTGYVLYRGQVGPLVNVGLPLVIAAFPLYVRYRYSEPLNAVLSLWIVAAAFLHAAGSLWFYGMYPWYDQFAHAVSGAMIAGVGYALVVTIDRQHGNVVVPPNLRFVFVLVFALAVGVLWEVAEFALMRIAGATGGESLLAQRGLRGVVLDLVFDAIGALGVALWGTEYFSDLRGVLASHVGARTE